MRCKDCETSIDAQELCDKIKKIYPEIGQCGIDVAIKYDMQAKAWAVTLSKGGHVLKTFLDENDVNTCREGKECIHLGILIGQLKTRVSPGN